MRPLRNHLFAMGVPVEGAKGEAEAGQEELNIRYADAMACADPHARQARGQGIAWINGHAATFLPKWDHARVGSSSHIHQSLWHDGGNAFQDAGADYGMSALMRHHLAGLIKYTADTTVFLAHYVNSYKRFAKGTFAPTKSVWSIDNRTAGYRLCADGTPAVRVECRIGGSDMNPYLALAAQLAAGIAGIEEKLELAAPTTGDVYDAAAAPDIPRDLRSATECLRGSAMLKAALGEDVVAHCLRCARMGAGGVRPGGHRLGNRSRFRKGLTCSNASRRLTAWFSPSARRSSPIRRSRPSAAAGDGGTSPAPNPTI